MSTRKMAVSLYRAIKINDIERVRELMRKNPDLLKLSVEKYSPLWEAMTHGRKEIVEVFMEFGADPDEKCSVKNSVIASGAKYTFLQFLASCEFSSSNNEMAKLLIRHGANVNAVNDKITSPLRTAIENGFIHCIELLLKNCARLEGPEWNKESPAYYVFNNKIVDPIERKKMLLLLLKYNLDMNFVNSNCENLLHTLIISNLNYYEDGVEMAEILLNAGVQLEFQNLEGDSPLHYAVDLCQIELVTLFLKRGTNVNIRNNEGKTPIFFSVQGENEDLIQLLLTNGAEINAKDNDGRTPLHEACTFQYVPNMDIIIFLIQNGADMNKYDDNNDSPIDLLMTNSYGEDELIMKEFAKLNMENPSFDLRFLDYIKYGDAYYESYMKELFLMAKTKFYPPYSYHCILKMSKNIKKLAKLTRNEKFVINFKENLHKFSDYKDDLERILSQAIKFKDDLHTVYSRLCSVFGDYLPNVVIRILADNMSLEDLPIE